MREQISDDSYPPDTNQFDGEDEGLAGGSESLVLISCELWWEKSVSAYIDEELPLLLASQYLRCRKRHLFLQRRVFFSCITPLSFLPLDWPYWNVFKATVISLRKRSDETAPALPLEEWPWAILRPFDQESCYWYPSENWSVRQRLRQLDFSINIMDSILNVSFRCFSNYQKSANEKSSIFRKIQ